jgi:hypothetical protein
MHSIDVDFIVPTAYEDFAGFAQIYCGEILFCMERPSVQTSSRKAVFLREKRLRNAQGRGLCEANACHAPHEMVCRGRGIVTWS